MSVATVLIMLMAVMDAACAVMAGMGGDPWSCAMMGVCAIAMLLCAGIRLMSDRETRDRAACELVYEDLRQLACLLAEDPRFAGCASARMDIAESLRTMEGAEDIDGQMRTLHGMTAFDSDLARRLVCVFLAFHAAIVSRPRDREALHDAYMRAMADTWDGADPRGSEIMVRVGAHRSIGLRIPQAARA